VVDVVIVLDCANAHVIARLKITDLRRAAGRADVFGRIRDRDRGDRLVVGFDDDILVPDVAQYPGESLSGGPAPLRWTSLRIPLARISATGNRDLAETGNNGQQENYRK
jgi:hypothetical protein